MNLQNFYQHETFIWFAVCVPLIGYGLYKLMPGLIRNFIKS